MGNICGDNRFEIIAKAKKNLLKSTNIHTSEDEMKVLDSFLFRCWQMGWLERYDKPREPLDIPTQIKDLISLVKRMREAQKKEWEIKSKQACGKELDEHTDIVTHLEREVDEYLKKMEE